MSSTSNAQDLLVNVFRPTYTYDSNTGFTPALVVSNVSELIAGRINTDRLGVADSNGNSYVGCNAGPAPSDLTTRSNVAIGVSAMAGASNSSNNVSVGLSNFSGISSGNSNVGLGANTLMTGAGQKNVLIGANVTLGTGSGNIVIGNDLALGNISNTLRLGNILYGNLTTGFIGINNPAPAAALDISGEVLFRNKVGIQKTDPIYTLDVAGSIYATEQIIGGKGTQSNPMYTFIDSSGSGMYVPVDPSYGTGSFGIAVNRAPAAIFSSNAVNFFQNLDVSGTFSARNIDISAFSVTDGTALIPSVTFTNDTCTGLFLVSSNRLGVATGGFRRMEVLSNGDVSMGKLAARDISLTGTIVGADPNTVNVIGGVTLSNGNVILTGTATNTNLLVPGWIRNNATTFNLDISGGNISNELTTRSSNFRASAGTAGIPAYSFASDPSTGVHSAGTSQLAFDTAGLQRMVISNGNVGIGKAAPVVALEVVGDVSATTYNGPGGTQAAPHYTSSDDRTTGLFFPGANMLGVTAGGTERMRISNGNVGIGTTTPANALDVAGTLRVIGAAGDLTFTNGTISLAGVPVISSTGVLSNAASTSNSIGGVTLNTNDISLSGQGKIVGMSSAANVIGGVSLTIGQISNSSYTTSSRFYGGNDGTAADPTYSFSNEQGIGVFRAGAGQLAFATSGSNRMTFDATGGISYAGAISNTVNNTSNRIGGVTLSNGQVTASGTTSTIGGVTLSSGGISGTTGTLAANSPGSTALTVSTIDNPTSTPVSITGHPAQIRISNVTSGNQTSVSFATATGDIRAGNNVGNVGDGVFAISNAGGVRFAISNANVGIGTSSPGFALDVAGVTNVQTAGAGGTLYVGGNTGLFMFCDAATTKHGYIRALGSTANLYLGASNTNHMIITNAGRVGIGHLDPSMGTLDISSAGTYGIHIRNPAATGNIGLRLSNGTGGEGHFGLSGSTDAWTPGTSAGDTVIRATCNFIINSKSTTRMVFKDAAIGIGTTAPRGNLEVFSGGIISGRGENLSFATDVSAIVEGSTNNGIYWHKGVNNYFFGITFKTLCNNTLAERMRIDADTGRVGINKTDPGYTLDVNGSARITGGLIFSVQSI